MGFYSLSFLSRNVHNWAHFKWMCLFESSLGKKVGIMMGELEKDRKTGFVRTWWSHSISCCIVSDGVHWKSVRSQGNIFFWCKVSTFSCKLASSCRITYNLENLSCQKRALGYQVREGQGILLRSFKSWRLFSIILQSAIIYLITRFIDWVIVVFEIDPSSPAAAVELEISKKLFHWISLEGTYYLL